MSTATQSKRNILLGTALAATVGLALWVQSQDKPADETDIALARPNRISPAPEKSAPVNKVHTPDQTAALNWALLDGRELDAKSETAKPEGGLFKPHSWYVPPPKSKEPAAPPPKPVAPLVPFAYVGRMEGAPQGTVLMLTANNKLYTVAAGEPVDKVWRLDGEDANSIRFTYLPLGLPQTLSKAGKAAAVPPNQTKKPEGQANNQGNNQ